MLPEFGTQGQAAPWQRELGRAIRDPQALLEILGLDRSLLPAAQHAARLFPLRVPRGFVQRMAKGDPDDPLLRQVLPLGAEQEQPNGYGDDPVGDLAAMRAPGLLHKYSGRVLLTVTGSCPVHCRYCFRRHFPYAAANPATDQWRTALDYLRREASVQEVILSGGDPLSLADHRLAALARCLEDIPHVLRLRIHTRMPVVLPQRVDQALLGWLGTGRLQKVMVLHVNHPNEVDEAVHTACSALAQARVTLLNQSVLLRGINDTIATLAILSERLFQVGVLPYYLHTLDRVRGAAHFEVERGRALELARGLLSILPGYLAPRLVEERPGAPSKLPLGTHCEP